MSPIPDLQSFHILLKPLPDLHHKPVLWKQQLYVLPSRFPAARKTVPLSPEAGSKPEKFHLFLPLKKDRKEYQSKPVGMKFVPVFQNIQPAQKMSLCVVIVIDSKDIVKLFNIGFALKIMTELQQETLIDHDQETEDLTNSLLKEALADISDPSEKLITTLRDFCGKRARELLAARRKTTEILEQTGRDQHNPEIYSENGWHNVMKGALSELRRKNQGAAILAIDLDNFKEYDDTYGHPEGDIALGVAGRVIKNTVRPSDIVARIHGDEFVVVLSNADPDVGVQVAERIRKAIPNVSTILNTPIQFTASIGVAALGNDLIQRDFTSGEGNEKVFNELEFIEALKGAYKLADDAHFKGAKHAGKDRIGVFLPDGTIKTAIINQQIPGHVSISYENPKLSPTPLSRRD